MSRLFTGKAVSKGVSMPTDMWAWLEGKRETIGVPISRYVQDAVEEKIERDAEPARMLIDTAALYETGGR